MKFYEIGLLLSCSSVLCLNLLIHLIKSFISERILEYQISYNDKKDSRNDGCEYKDCILYSRIIITQVSIISIYRSADE